MNDFIDTATIQQQFAEINRPGDWAEFCTVDSATMSALLPSAPYAGSTIASMVFDRILAVEPGVSLVAEKLISRAAPYFNDHFPLKPVLPMTVLLECKINLAREFVARAAFANNYHVSEFRKIKMNEFVQPGDVVISYLKVKQHTPDALILSFRSEVRGKRVCVVDVVLNSQ